MTDGERVALARLLVRKIRRVEDHLTNGQAERLLVEALQEADARGRLGQTGDPT